MPTTKEFSVQMEDQPGTLGRICRTLADRGVNILAFQSIPLEGKSQVRLVVDNPTTTKRGTFEREIDRVRAQLENCREKLHALSR